MEHTGDRSEFVSGLIQVVTVASSNVFSHPSATFSASAVQIQRLMKIMKKANRWHKSAIAATMHLIVSRESALMAPV